MDNSNKADDYMVVLPVCNLNYLLFNTLHELYTGNDLDNPDTCADNYREWNWMKREWFPDFVPDDNLRSPLFDGAICLSQKTVYVVKGVLSDALSRAQDNKCLEWEWGPVVNELDTNEQKEYDKWMATKTRLENIRLLNSYVQTAITKIK